MEREPMSERQDSVGGHFVRSLSRANTHLESLRQNLKSCLSQGAMLQTYSKKRNGFVSFPERIIPMQQSRWASNELMPSEILFCRFLAKCRIHAPSTVYHRAVRREHYLTKDVPQP